jgi:hypothetical protein
MSNYLRNSSVNLNGSNDNLSATSSTSTTSTEQLIYRLCSKLTSNSNIKLGKRDEFINSKYQFVIKLFCSQTFTPVYDYLELTQKIKKKCKCFSNSNHHFILICCCCLK